MTHNAEKQAALRMLGDEGTDALRARTLGMKDAGPQELASTDAGDVEAEFRRMQETVGALQTWRARFDRLPDPVVPRLRRSAFRRALVIAGAAAAVVVLVATATLFRRPSQAAREPSTVLSGSVLLDGAQATSIPQGSAVRVAGNTQAVICLADGSQAHLEPASRVVFHGAAKGMRQLVELLEGGGTFQVEKANGKFQVLTQLGSVTALGTEFSVKIQPPGDRGDPAMKVSVAMLAVAVTTGMVQVEFSGKTYFLGGGQQRVFAEDQGAPAAKAAEQPATKQLLELGSDIQKRLTPHGGSSDQVSAAVSKDAALPGLVVTIQPGKADYPGIGLKPAGKAWDLSAFGHVEAQVVNTGSKELVFILRVDNQGDWHDSPWSTEYTSLKPGQRGTVTVIFGHSYGHQPTYPLNPKEVVNILMFTGKVDAATSFRVESLVAGGPAGEKPAVDPASIRIKPKSGILLGPGATIDAKTQIETAGPKVSVAADGQSLAVVFPDANGEQSVAVKPSAGRWDLRDATEVRVKLKNEGRLPCTPSVQVTSNGGPTDLVTAAAPLAAGAEQEIVVPFAPAVSPKGAPNGRKGGFWGGWENLPGTGIKFTSDTAAAVRITAKHDSEATLLIESITAAAPPAVLPDWLGKRPPVAGDWVKTFDEEFDGPTIDQKKWNIYGPNFWDRASHWTKDNLILEGGMAKFHFEKKRGFHNDNSDPKAIPQNLTGQKESDYACGYLDTYGKWVQRYGYFEARVKLPRVPGLWPTFWMMPDRGAAAGSQFSRADTGNGGMELDIMEHLTRWGPYRYNVACHWDGYDKDHQAIGSTFNYVQADRDGFITPGLLWTPGSVVMYCNGKKLWQWENSRVSNVPSHFIFEVTTGGWDNNAVDDKQLPADYLIDYVRVWQRKDLASSADGYQPAPKPEKK